MGTGNAEQMCFPGLCEVNSAFTVPSTLENFQIWDQAAVLQGIISCVAQCRTRVPLP